MPFDPNQLSFINPELFDGPIVAVGGDLSAPRIWLAYHSGIFPWFNEGEEILWWSPDPRCVLYPDKLKISKSMQKILRNGDFTFTENQCFKQVIRECRKIKRVGQDGTWISNDIIKAFTTLNKSGFVKSYEAWQNGELVGGFYGIWVGKIFCGESMFSKVSNASKAAFINFVQTQKDNIEIIDCQVHTDHLESLGAEMISKKEYLNILKHNNEL